MYKNKCNEEDPFYVYKLNNKMLNGEPSYVFKSSRQMAELAFQLDFEKDGFLKNEYVFFDGKHDRIQGFKSLTLWTLHPISRKLVWLAIMDAEHEDETNLVIFWNTVNKMLQDYLKDPDYKFNPIGFVCDENHANWSSISKVYGELAANRVTSCEFHFKQSVMRHSRKLDCDDGLFIDLSNKLLNALTLSEFESAVNQMEALVQLHPTLVHWFQWWTKRKSHIFKAFKSESAPNSNLAEVGHAKLQSIGRPKMSLIECAREDVVLAVRQGVELKAFEEGVKCGGKGPTQLARHSKKHKDELKRAKAYGDEVIGGNPKLPPKKKFIPSSGKHRPADKVKNKGKNNKIFSLMFHHQILNLKICYGCKREFVNRNRSPPHDLILRHYCQRTYKNKDGVLKIAKEPTAAYFHLKLDCARRTAPTMELSDIVIHDEIRGHLSPGHKQVLVNFGIVL